MLTLRAQLSDLLFRAVIYVTCASSTTQHITAMLKQNEGWGAEPRKDIFLPAAEQPFGTCEFSP